MMSPRRSTETRATVAARDTARQQRNADAGITGVYLRLNAETRAALDTLAERHGGRAQAVAHALALALAEK